jgi:MoxR-like ATPase
MDDAWFTECADELARCLVDARACAEACERFLAGDAARAEDVRALAAPAAISRVLIELIDQPPQLVLSAVRLCRELTATAAREARAPDDVVTALRAAADSSAALLQACG